MTEIFELGIGVTVLFVWMFFLVVKVNGLEDRIEKLEKGGK
jgi:hypothetical protein